MNNIENFRNVDTRDIAFRVMTPLRRRFEHEKAEVRGYAIAYVLYYLSLKNNPYNIGLEELLSDASLSDNMKDILKNYLPDCWDIAEENINKFKTEELAAFILFNDDVELYKSNSLSTPRSLSQLVCELLEVADEDNVLELCSGKGSFLTELMRTNPRIHYSGIELNYIAKDIAQIRADISNCNVDLVLHNALTYKTEEKWDKLFSNYPFMVRSKEMEDTKKRIADKFDLPWEACKGASSDWMFNFMLLDHMKDGGKAIAIMTNGSTWNKPDKAMRQYFIENGLVEMVIALPSKLFKDTFIPTTLIVLSKGNNTVKMIDAHNVYTEERRCNRLGEDDIASIVEMVKNSSENAVDVELGQFRTEDYVLNPGRYIDVPRFDENGVELATITTNITRGAQLKADALEELRTQDATDMKFLMVSNISDGLVSFEEDQYLKGIPSNLEKYCVKNSSIVLSKTGNPIGKSAVVSVEDNEKIMANGNLYIIELDQTKVDPYYLQAYLSSEMGSKMLKSVYNGAIIRTLSLESLKKMIIPLPSLEKQKQIGNQYAAAMDEILLLRRRLEKATNKLKSIFDEEV